MEFTESDIEIVKRAFEELIDPDAITIEVNIKNGERKMFVDANGFKVSFFYELYGFPSGYTRIIGALLTANDEQFLTVSGKSLTECCCNMAKELQGFVARLSNVAQFLRGNVILNEFDKKLNE